MQDLTLYYNPRCSKSREALALLQAGGHSPMLRDYLEAPPTLAELERLQRLLGVPARALVRDGEPVYAELALADASDAALLAAIAAHPELLQRPIAVRGERAVIARPPELALQVVA